MCLRTEEPNIFNSFQKLQNSIHLEEKNEISVKLTFYFSEDLRTAVQDIILCVSIQLNKQVLKVFKRLWHSGYHTQWIPYTMYIIHSVYHTQCISYTVYIIHSVYHTQYISYTLSLDLTSSILTFKPRWMP